jgi:hypothetical protein
MQNPNTNRSSFDWLIFLAIHCVIIGGIAYAGFAVYGQTLGAWVAASAIVAGLASMYLFAKDVPGETLMKIWLGLAVAANAAYLVHNGARAIGVEAYNAAQIQKFEKGMAQAAQTRSRSIARQIGLSAKSASELERIFDDGVSLIAALLAFFELSSAIVIFSIASKRLGAANFRPVEQGREAPIRSVRPSPDVHSTLIEGEVKRENGKILPKS